MKISKKRSKITKRKAIDTAKDSYLLKIGPKDLAVCRGCSAVYHSKRWRLATDEELKGKKSLVKVFCPACQKIKDNFPGGYVTISGEFLKEHKEEILNLVKNKEQRAMYLNPLERIMAIKQGKNKIEITTTTEKFAQRLGQILHKAFRGEVEYKWSDDTKVARVNWSRQG